MQIMQIWEGTTLQYVSKLCNAHYRNADVETIRNKKSLTSEFCEKVY